MNKKRMSAVVTVKKNIAVQSVGYKKYYPLGSPEQVVLNLDRWAVDEIFIISIDRSRNNQGPDIDLLKRIAKLQISTPIVYGGGIKSLPDAIEVIQSGADRILVDCAIDYNPTLLQDIASVIGSQALIGSLPFCMENNAPFKYDYLQNKLVKIECAYTQPICSEIMFVDVKNEGGSGSFDLSILDHLEKFSPDAILFGGLTDPRKINIAYENNKVKAIAIGNLFTHTEHALQKICSSINPEYSRPPFYEQR